MGCWNETCFITNGAIRHGDPVVGFVVQQACNPGTVGESWLPITFPIVGTYDDYGGIENPTMSFEKELLQLWNTLYEKGELSQSARGEEMSKYDEMGPPFSLESIIRDVEREYIRSGKLQSKYFDDSYLGFVMAHKSAYDFLIENYNANQDKYNYFRPEDAITLEKVTNAAELCVGKDEMYDLLKSKGLSFSFGDTMLRDICGYYSPKLYSEFVSEVLSTSKDLKLATKELAERMTLYRAMSELRKPIYTASDLGKGSQQDNTLLKLALSKFEVEFWSARKQKDDEEYGEDA